MARFVFPCAAVAASVVLTIPGTATLTGCNGCKSMECSSFSSTSCSCAPNSNGTPTDSCESFGPCCIRRIDADKPWECSCGDDCDPSSSDIIIVAQCNAHMTTCDIKDELGGASTGPGGCYSPNWESDCANDGECDPGLSCTSTCPSCSPKCHAASCSSDTDCVDAYGSLTKDGLPYCKATCNAAQGMCEF